MPANPLTELQAQAAQVHELFCSYVGAGFTEDQAMRILLTMMTAANGGARDE